MGENGFLLLFKARRRFPFFMAECKTVLNLRLNGPVKISYGDDSETWRAPIRVQSDWPTRPSDNLMGLIFILSEFSKRLLNYYSVEFRRIV
jgi:hypothetical protein